MSRDNSQKVISITAQQDPRFNVLKWGVVVLLVVGGIVANTYFSDIAWALRTAIGIVLFIVALLIVLQTVTGRQFWAFAKASRIELRKVVWPTRQETIQTTLVVVAMVVFAALVLWGLDTLFFWLVGWLTGQRS